MIFDVYNMCDKISVSLLMIWNCPVRQLFCKSWLLEQKVDCPGQSGNLIVAPWINPSYFLPNLKDFSKIMPRVDSQYGDWFI